jgi:hypothetical protein
MRREPRKTALAAAVNYDGTGAASAQMPLLGAAEVAVFVRETNNSVDALITPQYSHDGTTWYSGVQVTHTKNTEAIYVFDRQNADYFRLYIAGDSGTCTVSADAVANYYGQEPRMPNVETVCSAEDPGSGGYTSAVFNITGLQGITLLVSESGGSVDAPVTPQVSFDGGTTYLSMTAVTVVKSTSRAIAVYPGTHLKVGITGDGAAVTAYLLYNMP